MAYPAGVSLAVIEAGQAGTFFGDDASVTARVTPVLLDDAGKPLSRIIHTATGFLMLPSTQVFASAAGSVLSFSVPHVDQPGWQDPAGNAYTMWAYKVDVTATAGPGKNGQKHSWTQYFQPLVGQDFIDLDPIPDGQVGAPVSAPVATVTSVNGQTGAVLVDAGTLVVNEDPNVPGTALIGG